jgi:hypothetical protein
LNLSALIFDLCASGPLRLHNRAKKMLVFRPLRGASICRVNAVPVISATRLFSDSPNYRRDVVPGSGGGGPLNFFGKPRLPTNKGIMFVPQQEAWV